MFSGLLTGSGWSTTTIKNGEITPVSRLSE